MSNRIHRPGETVPTSGQYGDAGYVSAEYGFMARSLNLGLQIGSEHSEISPPIEVPFPLFGTRLDALYCEALWNVLNADSDDARRLAAAIDWLDVAWRNTRSTTFNMRVLMLKSGFEVLLGRGERLDHQRPALSALLDAPNVRRRVRDFTDRRGNPVRESMSDLEWWFTRFTFLRNKIVHGHETQPRDLRHGRTWHLWMGEFQLRRAIKESVARQGYPLVRVDALNRAVALALQRLGYVN